MRIAFFSEGPIDEILVPPLIRCILETIDINQRVDEIDFEPPIRPRTRGYGWVLSSVRRIIENIDAFRKLYDVFILLIDYRSNQNTINELAALVKGHDEFIVAFAKPEIESWVLADTPNTRDWLQLADSKIAEFPCLVVNNFDFEKDQDHKKILTDMMRYSRSEYEKWNSGAAQEFIEGRWAGEGIYDYYITQIWTGRASLDLIVSRCPQGFQPFYRQILHACSQRIS